MSKQTSTGSWVVAVIVVAAVVAAGAYLVRKAMQANAPAPTTSTPPAAATSAAPSAAVPSIEHPIVQAGPGSASTTPLPALADSDADVMSTLGALAGGDSLTALLMPSQVIARIVATVDALPRHELGRSVLPVRAPSGAFATTQAEGQVVIDASNAARYAPYMRVVAETDPKALVAWYVRYYPLFQQAYRELGYPRGYFNDRLVVAIDDLLATPEPTQPPALLPVKHHYVYADPTLESLSVGQKTLLRVGATNESAIKVKLRAIRADLTGQALPASAK